MRRRCYYKRVSQVHNSVRLEQGFPRYSAGLLNPTLRRTYRVRPTTVYAVVILTLIGVFRLWLYNWLFGGLCYGQLLFSICYWLRRCLYSFGIDCTMYSRVRVRYKCYKV